VPSAADWSSCAVPLGTTRSVRRRPPTRSSARCSRRTRWAAPTRTAACRSRSDRPGCIRTVRRRSAPSARWPHGTDSDGGPRPTNRSTPRSRSSATAAAPSTCSRSGAGSRRTSPSRTSATSRTTRSPGSPRPGSVPRTRRAVTCRWAGGSRRWRGCWTPASRSASAPAAAAATTLATCSPTLGWPCRCQRWSARSCRPGSCSAPRPRGPRPAWAARSSGTWVPGRPAICACGTSPAWPTPGSTTRWPGCCGRRPGVGRGTWSSAVAWWSATASWSARTSASWQRGCASG
jgi:hypothetical protein